jgi:hypothetical protein
MVHVAVSQLPVSRQLIVEWLELYPVSQAIEALDPNVVVVKVTAPFVTFAGEPQSGIKCIPHKIIRLNGFQ